MAVINRP